MTETLLDNRIEKNIPNRTQEGRVLDVLKRANGEWVSKRYFVQTMLLSQAGRAIHNLQHDPAWQKEYEGYEIEPSDHRDEHNFKFYRLKLKGTLF